MLYMLLECSSGATTSFLVVGVARLQAVLGPSRLQVMLVVGVELLQDIHVLRVVARLHTILVVGVWRYFKISML